MKKHTSLILSLVGIAGLVATSVLSAKAAVKTNDILRQAEQEKGVPLTKSETIKTAVPVYLPAILMGTATATCILGIHILDRRQQASLISAYSILENYHKEYRKKVIEFHGEEADRKIQDAILRDRCDVCLNHLDVPDNKLIFYESISGESITAYEKEIMDAEYHLNRNFVLRGYASLNEFYKFLGLPETEDGDRLGWSCSYGYSWIDFEHHLVSKDDGGTPVYEIVFIFEPDPDYLREWE